MQARHRIGARLGRRWLGPAARRPMAWGTPRKLGARPDRRRRFRDRAAASGPCLRRPTGGRDWIGGFELRIRGEAEGNVVRRSSRRRSSLSDEDGRAGRSLPPRGAPERKNASNASFGFEKISRRERGATSPKRSGVYGGATTANEQIHAVRHLTARRSARDAIDTVFVPKRGAAWVRIRAVKDSPSGGGRVLENDPGREVQ